MACIERSILKADKWPTDGPRSFENGSPPLSDFIGWLVYGRVESVSGTAQRQAFLLPPTETSGTSAVRQNATERNEEVSDFFTHPIRWDLDDVEIWRLFDWHGTCDCDYNPVVIGATGYKRGFDHGRFNI